MRLGIDAEAMGEIRRANAAHARRMAEDSAREENSDDSDDGARASRSIASFERAFERWRKNPRSLLVFAPNSGFREGCRKVVESSAFETAIAGCIVASSVAVAVVKPKRDGTSEEMWLTIMGYVLTAVFGLEAILKIIARGFAFGEETYLSARWNQFDFFLVTVSLILLPIGGNSVMVFRLLRALHVFKIFNRYRSARLVMRTIFRALPLLGDVCLFLLWFVIFFAVSGVTVFGGRLTGRLYGTPPAQEGNASYALPTGTGKEVCAKLVAEWLGNESLGAAGTYPDAYNSTCNFASWNTNQSVEEYCCDSGVAPYDGFLDFDDAFRSAIVTLNGMTIDGWNELLNPAAYGVGFVNAFIWFIAVVIVGGFFMMELFTSVICATLQSIVDDDSQEEKEGEEEEEEEEKEKEEEEEEKEEEEEEEEKEEEGNKVKDSWNALRERCFIACKSDRFNNVVTGVIMLNTLLMMAQHANASSTFTSTSNILEYTFLAVFGMEMIFKHMAYGFIDYWRSKENALDGVIVVTGVFSSAMTSQGVSVSFLRLLRVGRAFRTFRVIRRNREFRRIISSSVLGFQDMWPFLVVWMLFSVIFAIFGFQLFSGLGTLDEERLTFKTFLRSTLTLFVISSGEDSFTVAWSTMVAYGNNFIVFYTIGWILISTVILSLVLGILIDSCALVEMEDDHAEAEERVKEKKEKLDEAVERASHIELASENALKRKVQNFTFALTALESTGALSNKSMSEDEFLGKAFSSVVPKELGGKLKNEPLKVSTSTSLAEGLKLKDNAGKIAQVNAARKRK
ncbi:Voltage-dependent channel, four helix bundle domain, partial [Ostreococcus tauri]